MNAILPDGGPVSRLVPLLVNATNASKSLKLNDAMRTLEDERSYGPEGSKNGPC